MKGSPFRIKSSICTTQESGGKPVESPEFSLIMTGFGIYTLLSTIPGLVAGMDGGP